MLVFDKALGLVLFPLILFFSTQVGYKVVGERLLLPLEGTVYKQQISISTFGSVFYSSYRL